MRSKLLSLLKSEWKTFAQIVLIVGLCEAALYFLAYKVLPEDFGFGIFRSRVISFPIFAGGVYVYFLISTNLNRAKKKKRTSELTKKPRRHDRPEFAKPNELSTS